MTLGLPLAAAYAPTAVELLHYWAADPNYSHGYVVPVLSLVFAARALKRSGPPIQGHIARKDVLCGLTQAALGLTLHLWAQVLSHVLVDVLSLVVTLRGLLLILGGRDAQRAYRFATTFLLFMAPLPASWYQPIALLLQQLVGGFSAAVFQVLQLAVYQEGYRLDFPGYTMEVGAACSGLRQLVAFFALGAAAAHLSQRRGWYKAALLALALPIAVAANCIRVTLTGLILIWAGPHWAEGVFHTLEGLAVTALGAGLLLGAAWCLGQMGEGWTGVRANESRPETDQQATCGSG